MAHDADRHCHCVAEHRPAPLELERHHVWPLAMGGPDTAANVQWLCPTAHTNAHELLRLMLRAGRAIRHWEFTQQYDQPVNRHAHAVAAAGYQAVATRTVQEVPHP